MKQWYKQTTEEILQSQQVTIEGLTTAQALTIRNEKGENILQEAKKISTFQCFWNNLKICYFHVFCSC